MGFIRDTGRIQSGPSAGRGRFSDYARISDEADRKEHVLHFCPDCGSQVFSVKARAHWPSQAAILLAVADPEQIAKWSRAEHALRASLNGMGSALDDKDTSLVEEFLDHNELGVAMDWLVEAALASTAADLPDGVVDHLLAASGEMHGYVPEKWDQFIARFG